MNNLGKVTFYLMHYLTLFLIGVQVMYLVIHCGITTEHEVDISPEEYNRILHRMRIQSMEKGRKEISPQPLHRHPHHCQRPHTVQSVSPYQSAHSPNYSRDLRPSTSRVLQNPFPMDNSRSFFEDMVSGVRFYITEFPHFLSCHPPIGQRGQVEGP